MASISKERVGTPSDVAIAIAATLLVFGLGVVTRATPRSVDSVPADLSYSLHLLIGLGFAYVAFVIDTFANRIVGWKVSRSAKTDVSMQT